MKFSFPPIVGQDPKVLILGTMPGEMSLQKQEYYGYPYNVFWKIMFALLKVDPLADYAEKCALLEQHGVALWDTLQYCKREGSLDSNIKEEYPNPIAELLKKHHSIQYIAFNGKQASAYFKRYQKDVQWEPERLIELPSTSPAYTLKFGEKLERWRILAPILARNEEIV